MGVREIFFKGWRAKPIVRLQRRVADFARLWLRCMSWILFVLRGALLRSRGCRVAYKPDNSCLRGISGRIPDVT